MFIPRGPSKSHKPPKHNKDYTLDPESNVSNLILTPPSTTTPTPAKIPHLPSRFYKDGRAPEYNSLFRCAGYTIRSIPRTCDSYLHFLEGCDQKDDWHASSRTLMNESGRRPKKPPIDPNFIQSVYSTAFDLEMAAKQVRYSSLRGNELVHQEEWTKRKLRETGGCIAENPWYRPSNSECPNFNGYRCSGGYHFMTDSQLAEGKNGFYNIIGLPMIPLPDGYERLTPFGLKTVFLRDEGMYRDCTIVHGKIKGDDGYAPDLGPKAVYEWNLDGPFYWHYSRTTAKGNSAREPYPMSTKDTFVRVGSYPDSAKDHPARAFRARGFYFRDISQTSSTPSSKFTTPMKNPGSSSRGSRQPADEDFFYNARDMRDIFQNTPISNAKNSSKDLRDPFSTNDRDSIYNTTNIKDTWQKIPILNIRTSDRTSRDIRDLPPSYHNPTPTPTPSKNSSSQRQKPPPPHPKVEHAAPIFSIHLLQATTTKITTPSPTPTLTKTHKFPVLILDLVKVGGKVFEHLFLGSRNRRTVYEMLLVLR